MAEQVVIRAHIVLDRQPHGIAGDEELDYAAHSDGSVPI